MSPRTLARLAAAATLGVLAVLAGCARSRPASAPVDGPRTAPTTLALEVVGHGRIVLAVARGWEAKWTTEGDPAQPSVVFTKRGARFLALLSPIRPSDEPESPQALADTATLYAELGRRRALAGSVEQELSLEELTGPDVRGAYFSATDRELVGREPRPDEFRHVLQGAAAVGPIVLAFTLLDDGPGPWRAELLEMVRTGRHAPEAAAGGTPPGEGGPSVEPMTGVDTVPLRVALPGRRWAVLVDLPGFQVARVAPGRTRPGTVHVLARSPDTEVIASVILSPAGDARDAAGCRERALAGIRGGGHALADLQRAERGGAAASTYTVPAGAGGAPEWHAHAFRWREGICVNVHVSKADPAPDDAARLDAVLSSVRVAEDL